MICLPQTNEADLLAVQVDFDLISDWIRTKRLRLNVGKTKSLVISRKRNPPVLKLHIDGIPISQVDTFKFLGPSDLSWSLKHLLQGQEVSRFCTIIFILRMPYLYKALVLPMLDYGCCIWDPSLRKFSLLQGSPLGPERVIQPQI